MLVEVPLLKDEHAENESIELQSDPGSSVGGGNTLHIMLIIAFK